MLLAALVVSGFAMGISLWNGQPGPTLPIRFTDVLPEEPLGALLIAPLIDVSRDGTRIAYVSGEQLYVRHLGRAQAQPLRGVSGLVFRPGFPRTASGWFTAKARPRSR